MDRSHQLRLLKKWLQYKNGADDEVEIDGVPYMDFYDAATMEEKGLMDQWDKAVPWELILKELQGDSVRVHRKYLRLPPPSSARFRLQAAVMEYLGFQDWDYKDMTMPMQFARVMAAITDELEAMRLEGIWTPPEG